MPKKKKHLIKSISLSKIKRYKNNPRTHDEKQIEILVQNIKTNGYINPIIVDKKMVIIAGHGRHQALEKIYGKKDPKINIVIADLTPKESRKQRIADNKIGELSKWDEELLSQEIMSIFDKVSRDAIEMDTGFSEKELVAMGGDFESLFDDGMGDTNKDDEIPNKVKKVTKKGDLWELGNHRVLCGDATKEKEFRKMMNGQIANMYFTDPPYSVNYTKKAKEILKSKHYVEIKNDDMSVEKTAKVLWSPTFRNAYKYCRNDSSFYITMPQGGDQMMMMIKNEKWQVKHELIWVKEAPVFSMNRLDYDYQHEPIAYGWKKKHKFTRKGKYQKSVWNIMRTENKLHPTMKPVELIENAINNSSLKNNIILDTFLGSGSTLIACEKTNRICYGMELDPHYCDVIRQRYIDFCKANNKKPIVKRNGKIFKV